MRVNLVPESARHLEMTRARQMRVDTRDLAEAILHTMNQNEMLLDSNLMDGFAQPTQKTFISCNRSSLCENAPQLDCRQHQKPLLKSIKSRRTLNCYVATISSKHLRATHATNKQMQQTFKTCGKDSKTNVVMNLSSVVLKINEGPLKMMLQCLWSKIMLECTHVPRRPHKN